MLLAEANCKLFMYMTTQVLGHFTPVVVPTGPDTLSE